MWRVTGSQVYAGPVHARPDDSPPAGVFVVGAATRDHAPDDPRGWRLGGPVAYASLVIARLGLPVTAMIGMDAEAATAVELDLLRDAGVRLRWVQLARGPVFQNVESPAGRTQRWLAISDPLPNPATADLARDVGAARGWYMAPVAGEIGPDWLEAIPGEVPVALGWQGMLREFAPDGRVVQRLPVRSDLLRRADLVGVSRDDLAPGTTLRELTGLLSPAAPLVLTHGAAGGIAAGPEVDGRRAMRRYPAINSAVTVDATGAGDTFLAALFAAQVEPRLIGGRNGPGWDLLLASAAASLLVEGAGLAGVPTRSAIGARMRRGLAEAAGPV